VSYRDTVPIGCSIAGDRILKQRVQELEQKVTELSEQVSIFNRVAAGCDAVLNAALVWIKQSK
jgi:hypothetical protein